jgi:hypothetical protein
MTSETTIRRRPDGSIDTDHYMAKGRISRSISAHNATKEVARSSKALASALSALVVLFFPQGGQS